MRAIEYSTQFQRDVKRAEKRGKNMQKLKELLTLLLGDAPLPPRFKDHPLKNDWAGYRDAHIEPDWLLIYCKQKTLIRFERTGSHSDLFD